MAQAPVCLVVGAGEGTGAAVARRFAAGGLRVALARRSAGKVEALAAKLAAGGAEAQGYAADAAKEAEVADLFARIERDMGPLAAVVFNASGYGRSPVAEMAAADFEAQWRNAGLAGFLVGREAAKHMLPRGRGTIVFTGATASLRGGKNFAGFAAGKHALRALAQSMARELGPQGIHVAHVVVDGLIDPKSGGAGDQARAKMIGPEDIAELYWFIHSQSPRGWMQECDIRPAGETW